MPWENDHRRPEPRQISLFTGQSPRDRTIERAAKIMISSMSALAALQHPSSAFRQYRLSNGIHLVVYSMPQLHTTAIGFWVRHNSGQFGIHQPGYAHFLEHLLFRGNENLDSRGLLQEFERFGGRSNAFTDREFSVLYGTVPSALQADLFDVFADMILEPRFTLKDFEIEKEIVRREIEESNTLADDAIEDFAIEHIWQNHPLGWPVLGSWYDIDAISFDEITAYHEQIRDIHPLWVVAAGKVDFDRLAVAMERLAGLPPRQPCSLQPPVFNSRVLTLNRGLSRCQMLWAMPAPTHGQRRFWACQLANHILAGSAASRLQAELGTRRNILTQLTTRIEPYSNAGLWLFTGFCRRYAARKCLRRVDEIVTEFCTSGPSQEELSGARQALSARLQLEQDDPDATMERIAREFIYDGSVATTAELLADIASVTASEVRDTACAAWQRRTIVEWS